MVLLERRIPGKEGRRLLAPGVDEVVVGHGEGRVFATVVLGCLIS
jgi:hypothetical protein